MKKFYFYLLSFLRLVTSGWVAQITSYNANTIPIAPDYKILGFNKKTNSFILFLLFFISSFAQFTPASVNWQQDTLIACYRSPINTTGQVIPTSDLNAVMTYAKIYVNTNLPIGLSTQILGNNVIVSGSPKQTGIFSVEVIYLSVWNNGSNGYGWEYRDTCVDILTIIVPQIPTVSFDVVSSSCGNNNGTIQANTTVSLQYSWSSGQTTSSLTALSAGFYPLIVTDSLGCQTSFVAAISDSVGPTAVLQKVDTRCGKNNGLVWFDSLQGLSPISYQWSSGSLSDSLINVSIGQYAFLITDNLGCKTTLLSTVQEESGELQTSYTLKPSCPNSSDGAIDLSVSNGLAPYTYLWSNNATSSSISGLNPGSYQVAIQDATGCTDSLTLQMTASTPISVDITVNSYHYGVDCWNESYSDEFWGITGGIPPYSIGTNTTYYEAYTYYGPGTYYTIIITDGNGCKDTALNNVQVFPPTFTWIPTPSYSFHNDTLITYYYDCIESADYTLSGVNYTYLGSFGTPCNMGVGGDIYEKYLIIAPLNTTISFQLCESSMYWANGCLGTTCDTITVLLNDITSSSNTLNAKIVPNPFDDFFEIQVNLLSPQNLTFELVDALGRSLWLSESKYEQGYHAQKVSTEILPKGIYTCNIYTEDGKKVYRKLIRQ